MIQCDETRPQCVNCVTAERRCPYLDSQTNSEANDSARATPDSGPHNVVSDSQMALDSRIRPQIDLSIETDGESMIHIELLEQWLKHTCRTCLDRDQQAGLLAAIVMNAGLRFPFLLHGTLALAALHLSYVRPAQHDFYLHKAKELQDEGLAGFQRLDTNFDTLSAMPAFLFSFVTGVHRLCYVLAYCRTNFDLFMASLTECIDILRGVTVVLGGNMAILRESELGPLLFRHEMQSPHTSVAPSEKTIGALNMMIQQAYLGEESSDVLTSAVEKLRHVDFESKDEGNESIGPAVVWMMQCPLGFTQLLREGNPAAEVILAYIAPLFHTRQACWAVGDSGAYMLNSIRGRLPPEWRQWLVWPEQMIGQS